jgi:hypothetical protein
MVPPFKVRQTPEDDQRSGAMEGGKLSICITSFPSVWSDLNACLGNK